MAREFNDQVTEFQNRYQACEGSNWGDELGVYAADLYDGNPTYPFPVIKDPLDATGVTIEGPKGDQIKDWDERDMCPFIWGGNGG